MGDLFRLQQGRCYYSGVPLVVGSGTQWRTSLERLDNGEGYTQKNAVLIARVFQSADHSARLVRRGIVHGSAQGSVEKRLAFVASNAGCAPQVTAEEYLFAPQSVGVWRTGTFQQGAQRTHPEWRPELSFTYLEF